MANLSTITAKKMYNGSLQTVYYVGSKQPDGWIYFNDDKFYRFNDSTNILQILYTDKNIWVNTNIMAIEGTPGFNTLTAGQLAVGMGIAAANTAVENAVQWAINKANNEWITYSQSYRNLNDPNGSSYDCSSFVITAFNQAGFDTTGATYTGNMRSVFTNIGFEWIPGTTFESSNLIRGDILLQESYHTELYIGNNLDVNCGTTPAAVITHWSYYTNDEIPYYGGWDGILRYVG